MIKYVMYQVLENLGQWCLELWQRILNWGSNTQGKEIY
jgi:hypothetical protein